MRALGSSIARTKTVELSHRYAGIPIRKLGGAVLAEWQNWLRDPNFDQDAEVVRRRRKIDEFRQLVQNLNHKDGD